MKVKATQQGFYDTQIRNVGDVFEVKKNAFSDCWMEMVSKPGPKAKTVVEPSEAPEKASFLG